MKAVLGTTRTSDDALLSALILRASRWAESYVGYPLSAQAYRETVISHGGRRLMLSRTPVLAVTGFWDSTSTADGSTFLTSEYRLDPGPGFVDRDAGFAWRAPLVPQPFSVPLSASPWAGQEPPTWLIDYVAGYSCFNDGSVRDFQRHSGQFTPGKNFHASGAFGPWLVTTDEIPDPRKLTLTTRLNGAVMQHESVGELCFDVPQLIEYCSLWTQLEPGDVIVTGTPGGVGAGRKPPVWMKAGDTVEVEISGIGTLRNPVVADPAD